MIRFLIAIVFLTISIFAEGTGSYTLLDFQPEDFSRNTFFGSIKATDNTEAQKFFSMKQATKPKISIGNIITEILPESIHTDNGLWHFRLIAMSDTKPQTYPVTLFSVSQNGTETELSKLDVELPDRNSGKNKQPLIQKLEPAGGVVGSSLTIHGNFFGDSVEQIVVRIYDPKGDPSDYYGEKELDRYVPTHLYNDPVTQTEQIRFTLLNPFHQSEQWTFSESIFGKKLQLKIVANYRSSNIVNVYLLQPNWKWKVSSIALIFTILLLSLLVLILRKNFIQSILVDSSTKTYSLSKFQGFLWTIVLLGSYIYVAICKGIVLKSELLPDFNASLLLLLGISYGGMLSSGYMKNKQEGSTPSPDKKPEWKDLFLNKGEVDLSRVQLFLFTIVTVVLYLFNLSGANVLLGLPDIPPTLHGLLTASQAGYLSGKLLTSNVHISYIYPTSIPISEPPTELQIYGSGFTDGMKVIIEGLVPIKAEWISPNEIKVPLQTVEELKEGDKNIILIPQVGNPTIFENKISFQV